MGNSIHKRGIWGVFVWLACTGAISGCAAPRAFWPQKDIPPSYRPAAAAAPRILLASRHSEFKQALVKKVSAALTAEDIGVKVTGVAMLAAIDAADFDAVVIINTCLAWGLDKDVQGFIDRQSRHERLIVVTTSAKGDWLPKQSDFDAISAASKLTDTGTVARNILTRIHSILRPQ